MAKVEVEIGPDGKVKVHVLGVSGPSCMKLTQALEQELGTVEKVVRTAEFYEVPRTAPVKRTVSQ